MSKRAKYLLDNFEDVILACVFVVMSLFVILQIVSRYVFRSPLVFTEEAARYSYIWITYLGMAVVTKQEAHIRIDLLSNILKGKARQIFKLVVDSCSVFLYGILVFVGAKYTLANAIQTSPAMEISKAFIYVSLPLGALLSIVRLLGVIKRDVREPRTNSTRTE
jgi:TRAP-type C4-dicarboxylate transport system permease small subunit